MGSEQISSFSLRKPEVKDGKQRTLKTVFDEPRRQARKTTRTPLFFEVNLSKLAAIPQLEG